jgi:UMF1 family MFS transporter
MVTVLGKKRGKKRQGLLKQFTKQERSWMMYDWANSVYATIMISAIFPIYFTSVAGGEGTEGDFWWGIGTSVGMMLIAILAPIIGAFADFNGMKKKLLTAFLVVGLAFVAFGIFVDDWRLLLLAYVFSRIGFAGSNLLYDSLLTDVTTSERMNRVSSWGYAAGYIGGSTIPFILAIVLVTFGSSFGVDSVLAVKLSLVITILWWSLFSIPLLKNVQQKFGVDRPKKGVAKTAFRAVWKTFREICQNKSLLFFMISYFFYIDGVGTVITMATAYGGTLGLGQTGMIGALFVTQIVAVPFSILFSWLSDKFGSVRLITVGIFVYIFICCLGFVMGFGVEEEFMTIAQAQIIFWVLSFFVGMVQGGIQGVSRGYFGQLTPPDKSGEYFGFFDVFGKFAAVLGPLLYALIKGTTGRSSYAILSIILLFVIALVAIFFQIRAKKAEVNRPNGTSLKA